MSKQPRWRDIPRQDAMRAAGMRRREGGSWHYIGRVLGWPWQSIQRAVSAYERGEYDG